MDIRLNAKLSAYGKFPPAVPSCSVDTVTKEEIDSLFGDPSSVVKPEVTKPTMVTCSSKEVSYADIDALFDKE